VTAVPQDCPTASAAASLGCTGGATDGCNVCATGATGLVMDHEMVYDIQMVDG
jgi:hypothetical protein